MPEQIMTVKRTDFTINLEKTLTTGQAAKIIGMSARMVQKAADSGLLKSHRIPGSADRRYYFDDVIELMRNYGMRIPVEYDPSAHRVSYGTELDIPGVTPYTNPIEFGAYLGNTRQCRVVYVGDCEGLHALYHVIDLVRGLQPRTVTVAIYSPSNEGSFGTHDKADLRFVLPYNPNIIAMQVESFVKPFVVSKQGKKL